MSVENLSDDLARKVLPHFADNDIDDKYFAEQTRRRIARETPSRLDTRGKGVFLADDITPHDRKELTLSIVKSHMWLCTDRARAGVLVANDIGNLGRLNSVSAALGGMLVATPSYITSNGKHGPSLKYEATITKKRWVWCSPGFVARHPVLYGLIRAHSSTEDSKWIWLANKAAVLQRAKRRRNADMIIFVRPDEQRSQDPIQHES